MSVCHLPSQCSTALAIAPQLCSSSRAANKLLNLILNLAGQWPDNPEAFAKMKAALGCQLAEELGAAFGVRTAASEACVDVLAGGFAFRLFITSERWVPWVLGLNLKAVPSETVHSGFDMAGATLAINSHLVRPWLLLFELAQEKATSLLLCWQECAQFSSYDRAELTAWR